MKASPSSVPAIFTFSQHNPVRIVEINGEPWFIAVDVCSTLSISNSRDAIEKLDSDEKGVALTYTLGGKQKLAVVNESGLYTLILRCRDATKAGSIPHRFRKWVTSEVLPAIRKHGVYAVPTTRPQPPAYAGGEPLNATDMANLRRVIWRISSGVLYEEMWIKAAWKALRASLNVPAGQRFTVDQLPMIADVLREVCRTADATRAACDQVTEAAIKQVNTGNLGNPIKVPAISGSKDPLKLAWWTDMEIAKLTSRSEAAMDHPSAAEPA